MYTQNGNPDRNVEAVVVRTVWPDWIAALEASAYANPAFVPLEFAGFTAGYDTHSAVLFPETVAAQETVRFSWPRSPSGWPCRPTPNCCCRISRSPRRPSPSGTSCTTAAMPGVSCPSIPS
jgi:hypothetical protein